MKLQLFIVGLLNGLVLTNQKEGEQLNMSTDEESGFFNISNFQLENITYIYDGDGGDLCLKFVPGFNSLCMMMVYIIVFVFSVLGNGMVIFVVCSMGKSRTSTDIYLMHLAVADLLFCVTLPFWATETHYGWVFGNFLCKLLSGFRESSVYSGVFLLACISVDRYFAIVRATRRLSSNHLLVMAVCGVVWLVAGLLSLPVAIKRESNYYPDLEQRICHDNVTAESSDLWRVNMHILHHTLGFFLPLVVMVVCYGWTLVTLLHSRNQHKHKAMRVILVVVLAFILCWLPYNITELVDTLMRVGSLKEKSCETRYRVEMTLEVTKVLAYTHCVLNPVLYAFIGEKFWNQLLSALYKHGLLSKRLWVAYRKGSASSIGSIRSKQTSFSMYTPPHGSF